MATRLVLVCHAATSATRRAAFPADEPVEVLPEPAALRADVALCAPARCCRQTADALGLDAAVEDRLRDLDHGRWRGRTLDEVDPAELRAWLTDPDAAPHGGESVAELLARADEWLSSVPLDHSRVVAVTHPAVVKAVVVRAILSSPASFWRIDVPPLSRTVLSGRPGAWTLRSLAGP